MCKVARSVMHSQAAFCQIGRNRVVRTFGKVFLSQRKTNIAFLACATDAIVNASKIERDRSWETHIDVPLHGYGDSCAERGVDGPRPRRGAFDRTVSAGLSVSRQLPRCRGRDPQTAARQG